MSEQHDYRPIKIIIPHKDDLRPPRGGGGKAKDFTKHLAESRSILTGGIRDIYDHFDDVFCESNLPVVARVRLRDEALAKSHRPDAVFNHSTCPIIGNLGFGELLISIQPNKLKELQQLLDHRRGDKVYNDISKIQSIAPYRENDALGGVGMEHIQRFLRETRSTRLKLRLFNHRDDELNRRIISHLSELSGVAGVSLPKRLNYGDNLTIFSLDIPADIERLHAFSGYVGTQSLQPFERFRASAQSIELHPLSEEMLPKPDPNEDYPLVGIIDTGTDPNNALLQEWVVARDVQVPPQLQNNEHGSLVAGTIINGKQLNHGHPGFPEGRAKIVDIVAMSPSEPIEEPELIEIIREACESHREVKVWNLSINSDGNYCKDSCFSSFAIALDGIQDDYGCMIVNSAGNYQANPMPIWRRPDLNDADRVTAPADSLRTLTVGSKAHIGHPNACAQVGEPSPFTRKGPGAANVPKPEISHYGGNTFPNLQYRQLGILSINANGHVAETVGTSFAAPLAAATAARLWNRLDGTPTRHLVKAMMIHSAVLNSGVITRDDLPYTGFGTPPDVEEMLKCKPSEATLIFDLDLPYARRNFQKPDFPVPPCLHRNGKIFGEIIMTLVYDPPVDPDDGAAYSQVNVNPSIGMCRTIEDKDKFKGRLVPYPEKYEDLFEKNQVKHGYKWAPVKVFRANFSKIKPQKMWQINMDMSKRKPEFEVTNQPVALIVTIRDPEGKQPVYDEVVAMMSRTGWQTQNLAIKSQTRVRAGN